MVSPHLQAERENLLTQIAAIQQAGEIAPPDVRIEPDFLNPKCWLLTHTNLPMKERKLGQAGSPKHRDWTERISRRDRLQELQQQLTLLQGLIDRQLKAESLFVAHLPTINAGDVIEFEGRSYQVTDVGLRYLQLVDGSGRVTRCAIEQAKLANQARV